MRRCVTHMRAAGRLCRHPGMRPQRPPSQCGELSGWLAAEASLPRVLCLWPQGPLADEEQTFIKLFTMMYGDFDVNFLSSLGMCAEGIEARGNSADLSLAWCPVLLPCFYDCDSLGLPSTPRPG